MIQRKQTIWLLLATIVITLAFILPYGINKVDTPTSLETMLTAKSNVFLIALTILTAITCFFSVFLYKNRKQQMKCTFIPILLSICMIGFEIYNTYLTQIGNKMVIGLYGSQLIVGIFIPIVTIILIAMAYNGIKSDEKLIRDTDRLR
jgi:uncharacterized membrane protein